MGAQDQASASGGPDEGPPKVTPQIAAEAATWVARLHGPGRDRRMELQCLQWQAQSAAHRHAFERCTEVWMEVPNAARLGGYEAGSPRRSGRRPRGMFLVAGVALLGLVAGGLALRQWAGPAEYRTAVGEAQTVVLEDGTRMSLNTDTRVQVRYGRAQRAVTVGRGEVAFEVAKDAGRPFVARAGGSEVVALGTVFSVRLAPRPGGEALAVTLLEGQVAVRAADGLPGQPLAPAATVTLRPGERFVLAPGGAAPVVDRPRAEQVLAWKRNLAVFDGASLAEAVAEMNRYSRTPVVLVGDLARADWQVSGQFRTGDNAAFAQAIAMLHGLVVNETQGRLELSRAP